MTLQLELGKVYRDKYKNAVTIVKIKPHNSVYPYMGGNGINYTVDGRIYEGLATEGDLVEEVREPKYDFKHTADAVNHPAHYTQGGIECIEAIKAAMSADAFRGYLRGNAIKYLWRYEHKGGAESLAKAQWYIARLQVEVEAVCA